jgi:hypothetical protein
MNFYSGEPGLTRRRCSDSVQQRRIAAAALWPAGPRYMMGCTKDGEPIPAKRARAGYYSTPGLCSRWTQAAPRREPDHDPLVHGRDSPYQAKANQGQGKRNKVFLHTLCTCGADASRAELDYPTGLKKRVFPARCCLRVTFNP